MKNLYYLLKNYFQNNEKVVVENNLRFALNGGTMKYEKDHLRELLINSIHSENNAKDFFERNLDNGELLKLLINIAFDDYSNDARMESAFRISKFDKNVLINHEIDLLKL